MAIKGLVYLSFFELLVDVMLSFLLPIASLGLSVSSCSVLQFSLHLLAHFLLFLGFLLLEAVVSILALRGHNDHVSDMIVIYFLWQVLHVLNVDKPNLTSSVSDHETFSSLKKHSSQVSNFLKVAVLTESWRHGSLPSDARLISTLLKPFERIAERIETNSLVGLVRDG